MSQNNRTTILTALSSYHDMALNQWLLDYRLKRAEGMTHWANRLTEVSDAKFALWQNWYPSLYPPKNA